MSLDDLMPEWHFRERHERRIAAPPGDVWAELHELRLSDSRLARALMDVRILPARVLGRDRPPMVTGRFIEHGPIPLLAAEPERALVLGGVLQPWKLRGAAEPPDLDAAALRGFRESGWVKCAMDFVLEPDERTTLLRTETRVQATDRRTYAVFALYWLFIRAGSGLLRRGLLSAVAQRAEASARSRPHKQ